jgi:hypothetical protein
MVSVNDDLSDLNGMARRLLVYLHSCAVKMGGRPFTISPQEPYTLTNTGLDAEGYMKAASWLIRKHLAKWLGSGGVLMITDYGIKVGGDQGLIDRELPIAGSVKNPREGDIGMSVEPDKEKVFVIHGRDNTARHEMGVFLRSMGLEPLWFRDVRKNMSGTVQIIKVVEHGMELAQGVLALFTPDEFAALHPVLRKKGESGDAVQRWQARPNVLFEAGLAYGRDPDRVAFVLFGDAKLFTDASGMHVFWPTNEHGPDSSRAQLRGLLGGGMQCMVNKDSDDWMTAGNFDAVTTGLSGVSARDPFRP